jgi:hypothetical protein
MDTTDKRPPLFAKERAGKEQPSSNCVFLPPRKPPGQLSEQTSARLWIGASWIALVIETQQNNEHDVCIGHQSYATRTRDLDEAATAYRAAATRYNVETSITPRGRIRGDGIKLAYELKQRGIDVSLDTLDERAERHYESELAWADQPAGSQLSHRPFPDWQR